MIHGKLALGVQPVSSLICRRYIITGCQWDGHRRHFSMMTFVDIGVGFLMIEFLLGRSWQRARVITEAAVTDIPYSHRAIERIIPCPLKFLVIPGPQVISQIPRLLNCFLSPFQGISGQKARNFFGVLFVDLEDFILKGVLTVK